PRVDWVEHHAATVVGTRNLVEACKRHGVEKLIYISSLVVVDQAAVPPGEPISEATPLEPRAEERGAYTRAKLQAEMLIRDYASQGGPVVILRPGQIFGDGMPVLTPAVARQFSERWLVLGDGEQSLPLIHVDD